MAWILLGDQPMRRLERPHHALAPILAVLTLVTVGALLVWDAFPKLFPPRAHDLLGAVPLVLIAMAYLAYQTVRWPGRWELLKAIMLAAAFLFWAVNQYWPELPEATLFNDIAIALFVLDVFLAIIGWPASAPDESFAKTLSECDDGRTP